MAEYFQIPEVGTKVRPGSYFNVDKNGDDDSFGAIDGVVVAVFKATFGPVDKVTVLERGDDYTTIYGDGLTTDLIREVLYGGAKKVICCRLNGTGGAVASVSLTAATGKVKITAKHPGEMPFSVTIRNRLTDKDRKEFANDLKTIYHAPDEEQGYRNMQVVAEKWDKKYPRSMDRWKDNWAAVSPMFKFSDIVRRVIYTTNAIESLNSGFRRLNRSRNVFPDSKALLKALYLAADNITKKWTNTLRDWGHVYAELSVMYGERLS